MTSLAQGSVLSRHGKEWTVFAGYHYDINFLIIQGHCRFLGQCIWLRNGQKDEVHVPVGCLFIQAGKQLQWLTGGDGRGCCQRMGVAGCMRLLPLKDLLQLLKRQGQAGKSLWRVTSIVLKVLASLSCPC